MKVTFQIKADGKRHRYCSKCYSEKIRDVSLAGKTYYQCSSCGKKDDRLIDLDPRIVWGIDPVSKDLVHNSVGVIVARDDRKILLFDRTIYPYGHTIPAGHLDVNEKPVEAAKRELKEETDITLTKLHLLAKDEKIPDKCRKGADYHIWNLYVGHVQNTPFIKVDQSEGQKPVWLTVDEALGKNLTSPVKYFLEKYGEDIYD